MAKTTSLFKYVLGNRFEELPAPLRAMLAGPEPRWYRGTATVTRGSGTLSRLVAGLMGLPRKAQEIPFSLEVVPGVHRETWIRHFGRKKLRTSKRPSGRAGRGRIVERVGALTLTLELTVEGGELVYRTLSARLLGVPLPRFVAPTVDAAAAEVDGKLSIESTTRAGGIGRLLRYHLVLAPEPVSAAEMAAAEQVVRAHLKEPERTMTPTGTPSAKPGGAKPAAPSADPTPATAPDAEPTLMAHPASAAAPESQRAPHPAEPGATTVPIDTQHMRPGKERAKAPRPEPCAPRPAAPNEATVPMSPSKRRGAPDGGEQGGGE